MLNFQPDLLRHESDFPVQFGRYTLQGILGEGGMARVFRAELQGAEGFRKPAAVKIVRAAIAADNDNLRKALINEARVGGLLHHPNVVETYDYGEVEGYPYIAMELVRGIVLDEVLALTRRLEPARAMEIAIQICSGLDHAHNLSATGQKTNLVHRDLKPSNIIISRDGLVKVMDFGIAKASALSSNLTKTGTTKGTPAYMSPEQVGGQKLDRRSDIFSLGAIISELALGKKMFHGETLISVLSAVIQVEERLENSEVLNELDAFLPGLGGVVHRCLRMNPELRYPDAAAVESALQGLAKSLPAQSAMKLWALELMEDAESEIKATAVHTSWSSLDDHQDHPQLDETIPTDSSVPQRPVESSPAAAAAASEATVRETTPQAPAGAPSAHGPAQIGVQETRPQTSYPPPTATEAMLESPVAIADPIKPAGTLWTQSEGQRGLPIGLILGLLAGLMTALAAVGAIVIADRVWPEDEQVATANPKQSASNPQASRTQAQPAAAEKSKPASQDGRAGDKQHASAAPATQGKARPAANRGGDDVIKHMGGGESFHAMEKRLETEVQDLKAKRAKDGQRRQSRARTSSPTKQQDDSVELPKWAWKEGQRTEREEGSFSVQTRGLKRVEATVHVTFADGSTEVFKMHRRGSAKGLETWRSDVIFPKAMKGTVRWKVRVRARQPDGTHISRTNHGRQFRI